MTKPPKDPTDPLQDYVDRQLNRQLNKIKYGTTTKPSHASPPSRKASLPLDQLILSEFNSRMKIVELISSIVLHDDFGTLDKGAKIDLMSQCTAALTLVTTMNTLQAVREKGVLSLTPLIDSYGTQAVSVIRQIKLLQEVLLPKKEKSPDASPPTSSSPH